MDTHKLLSARRKMKQIKKTFKKERKKRRADGLLSAGRKMYKCERHNKKKRADA